MNYTAPTVKQEAREILVGLLLGTCSISMSENKTSIFFEMPIKNEDFVIYLYHWLIINNLYLEPYNYRSGSYIDYETVEKSIYFESLPEEDLNFLATMFLSNGEKSVPSNIGEWLTPRCMAHWIISSGQVTVNDVTKIRNVITIRTDNYTLQEVNLLIEVIIKNLKINCYVHPEIIFNKVCYRIRIEENNFEVIKDMMWNHIDDIESFYNIYK